MCQSKAEGGKRCPYADQVQNVRRKALYKHRNDRWNAAEEAEKAVRKWKDENPTLVAEHLPEKFPWSRQASTTPIPKDLMALFTQGRDPVTGFGEDLQKKARQLHEEREALMAELDRSEESAVISYTITGFELINSLLRRKGFKSHLSHIRKQDHDAVQEQREKTRKRIEHLDAALAKNQHKATEPQKLYRFFRVPAGMTAPQFIEKYLQEGEGFMDRGFMSTSADPEFVMSHVMSRDSNKKNHYVMFEILTTQGVSVQPHPYTRGGDLQSLELEHLIPRNAKFRVVKSKKRQKFLFSSDRRDLHQSHAKYGWSGGFQYGKTRKEGTGQSFPTVQIVDEALLKDWSKKGQQK